ncbi:MAG: ABC transporter ATP-binding protein [Desulfomonile sp.]
MILSVNQISFRYNSRSVLRDVTFELQPSQILGVLGINGAGKSTLLKCINRVLRPVGGSVLLNGTGLHQLRGDAIARRIGYVPQRYYSEDQVTVFDAVLLGRKPHIKWAAADRDLRVVEKLLKLMGLEEYALRPLSTLSGGEAQKVIIARALAQEPKVLLLDEPTSSLDLRNQLEVMNLVVNVVRTEGVSAVVAIHDLNLALRFVDLFLILKDGLVHAMGLKEALTPEVIEDVYGVHSILRTVEGYPVIIPVHCCRPAAEEGGCA